MVTLKDYTIQIVLYHFSSDVFSFFFQHLGWTRTSDGEEYTFITIEDEVTANSSRISLITELNTAEGSTKYDLVISPVRVGDAGVYRCTLDGEDAEPLSYRDISLIVDVSSQYGEPLVLSCAVLWCSKS